jgi:DHA2 family multidrug resistance protein
MREERFRGARLLWASLILSTSNFMVVLDTTIANVSIPHIAGSLGVSANQATWTITSYAVADAITVVLSGWLSQRFGGVRTFTACLIGFAFFSVLCGLSVTLDMLVAARIGQGLCGGPLIPLSQTLMMRIYPPEKLPQGMSYWTLTTMLGPVLGPVAGGLISDGLNWHWIFLINIPFAIPLIIACPILLGSVENETAKVPIDNIGLGLMILWIGALQIILDIGRERDWFADPTILALGVTAVLAFVAFIIWELTEEHPVVDLRVCRHRSFTIATTCFTLGYASFQAGIVVIPQWMQFSLGYTATYAGYATCVTGFASFCMSQFPPRLLKYIDARLVVTCGMLWMGAGTLLRTGWTSGADFWTLTIPQAVMGLAIPFFFTTLISIGFAQMPQKEAASAAGLFAFMRTMGLAFGISLSLTYWDNQSRVAGSELAGRLNSEATQASLAAQGFSFEQARTIIAQAVDKEAITLATDKIFLVTGLSTIAIAALIWMIPRPRLGAGGGAH